LGASWRVWGRRSSREVTSLGMRRDDATRCGKRDDDTRCGERMISLGAGKRNDVTTCGEVQVE